MTESTKQYIKINKILKEKALWYIRPLKNNSYQQETMFSFASQIIREKHNMRIMKDFMKLLYFTLIFICSNVMLKAIELNSSIGKTF